MGIARLDEARAMEVLERVLHAVRTGQYPFDNYRLSHELRNLPTNLTGPKDHSLFLFRSLLWMQGGIKTEGAMQGLRRMYEAYPDMFPADECLRYSPGELTDAIRGSGLTHYNVRPPWWQHNSEVLLRCWDGDPRNILLDMPDDPSEFWAEALKRVATGPNKFQGAQEKITALFIDNMVDSGLTSLVDTYPAVDIRIIRVLGSTGAVWGGPEIGPWKELNIFRSTCREAFRLFSEIHGGLMNEVGNATWFFGGEMCAVATSRQIGKGDKPSRTSPEVCGRCILSDLCNWVAPASKHYKGSGGIAFLPRLKEGDEMPLLLELDAPLRERCYRHRQLWLRGQSEISCGDCHRCDP